nr:DUF3048 domain-containing protein [Chloroflexota bacterium]
MSVFHNMNELQPSRLMTLILLIAVSTVFGVACGSSSNPGNIPPTRTPKPTFTIEVHAPTPYPSPTPEPSPTPTATITPTPTPTVNPYFNPLTGELVQNPSVLQRRPLLVRIGNDPEVRPQSGLSEADMVYEEAMDGWTITRLTAIIWSKDPRELKPVRSARLFTIDLGYMFDGALVHSGANDQVRWLISRSTITDLDEYFHPDPYYWLQPQGKWKAYPWMGRVATSAQRVRDYLAKTGKEKAVRLEGFSFSAADDPPPKGEPATYILIPYPRRALVEYRYNSDERVYKRFVQGEPHTDALNGQQLSAANVIVHYAKYEETDVKDVNGAPTFNIVFSGEGRAQIFRDGVMIEAKWVKPGTLDFCKYVYLDGTPVPLRPGQTWVEVVPTDYQITYKAD